LFGRAYLRVMNPTYQCAPPLLMIDMIRARIMETYTKRGKPALLKAAPM